MFLDIDNSLINSNKITAIHKNYGTDQLHNKYYVLELVEERTIVKVIRFDSEADRDLEYDLLKKQLEPRQ